MAVLGITSKPIYAQEYSGANSLNQQAGVLTLPAGGPWRIYRLGCWVAGWNSNPTVYMAVWDPSGTTVLGSCSGVNVASYSAFGLQLSFNYEQDLSSSVVVPGGYTVYVGWSRTKSGVLQWGKHSGGTHLDDTASGNTPETLSGYQSDTSSLGIYLYYTQANQSPNTPWLTSPADWGWCAYSNLTPTLQFSASDPDAGDTLSKYDLQVTTDGTFASITHWNDTNDTTGISGWNVSRTYAGSGLSRSVWYYWRVRVYDAAGAASGWSSARTFRVNEKPTAGSLNPSTGLATIWNLNELAVWTSGGSHAKPQVSWVYSDASGQQSSAYQVRLYAASAGGSPLWDSGKTGWVAASGTQGVVNVPYAIVLGTEYWWTIEVWDSMDETSGESARQAFKVRWGQAIYEANPGTSANWQFSAGAATGAQVVELFATATGSGGAGRSAWATSISDLTPAAWLNVLVRMRTATAGVNATLADMTFTYLGAATQPDRWAISGLTGQLDPARHRYGTQSFRLKAGGTNGYAYPFLKTSTADTIPVLPGKYTLSAWVKTDGALTGTVKLAVEGIGANQWYGDDAAQIAAGNLVVGPNGAQTQNSAAYPEGWQRLSGTFTVPDGYYALKVLLYYFGSSSSDQWWVDAFKLEEGPVATAWTPGFVSDPVVLDANGIQVDASAGAIMRMRGSAGGARDIVELGTNGLKLGGDAEITSPSANSISVPNLGSPGQITSLVQYAISGFVLLGTSSSAGKWAKIAHGALTQQWYFTDLSGRIFSRYDSAYLDVRIVSDNGLGSQPSQLDLRWKQLSSAPTITPKLVVESVGSSIVWSLWMSPNANYVDVMWFPTHLAYAGSWLTIDPPDGTGWQTSLPSGTQYSASAWP